MQLPAAHLPTVRQPWPSLAAVNAHAPVLASQASAVQGLLSWHTILSPTHLPALQASCSVHRSPSLQLPSSCSASCAQPVFLSQESTVQSLPASQSSSLPGRQIPDVQWSLSVQALPSLHGLSSPLVVQPVMASQPSSVHRLASSQLTAWPDTQLPLAQTSP